MVADSRLRSIISSGSNLTRFFTYSIHRIPMNLPLISFIAKQYALLQPVSSAVYFKP